MSEELKIRIETLEEMLTEKKNKYDVAVKANKNFNVARELRDDIHELKQILNSLYRIRDKPRDVL